VLRWLEKGSTSGRRLRKRTTSIPAEALKIDDASLPDVQSHYEYLLEHERIVRRLKPVNPMSRIK